MAVALVVVVALVVWAGATVPNVFGAVDIGGAPNRGNQHADGQWLPESNGNGTVVLCRATPRAEVRKVVGGVGASTAALTPARKYLDP